MQFMEKKTRNILIGITVLGVLAVTVLASCGVGMLIVRNQAINQAREAEKEAYDELDRAADKLKEALDSLD